jgi:hypothetical protein
MMSDMDIDTFFKYFTVFYITLCIGLLIDCIVIKIKKNKIE